MDCSLPELDVLPEMDWGAPGFFTDSKRILQHFAEAKKVDTTFILQADSIFCNQTAGDDDLEEALGSAWG